MSSSLQFTLILLIQWQRLGFRSDLPLADALHSNSERPLQPSAQLKGIAADLNDVVDESAHGCQGKGGGEKHHVAKLDKHLLVVLEGVLRGTRRCVKTRDLTHQSVWMLPFDNHIKLRILVRFQTRVAELNMWKNRHITLVGCCLSSIQHFILFSVGSKCKNLSVNLDRLNAEDFTTDILKIFCFVHRTLQKNKWMLNLLLV